MTISEVSKRLGFSESCIRGYCRTGRIKSQKIGKEYRIDEEELNKYISKTYKTIQPYDDPNVMTTSEAADALRCTQSNIYKLIQKGKLKTCLISGKLNIYKDSIYNQTTK